MNPFVITVIIFLLIIIALALLAISGNIHKYLNEPRDRQHFLNLLKVSCSLRYDKRTKLLSKKYAMAFLTTKELIEFSNKLNAREILSYLKELD